ncbi:hypothetical protein Trco_004039 [Trichoderma cornu-damae]|uniref:Hydrophobin n=1 Tax=Trichoderma cornu-damae TaxID=654480 RepID=A0A9P8QM68_9HYPO|nr:hypothetical protein Trco_004039 [Trichoderma cornu-damae]
MKPSSILLLTAAGLASALPALPLEHHVARHAPEARSLFGRAVGDVGARNPVALSANAAAPRDAGLAAGKDDADAHSLPPREAALPSPHNSNSNNNGDNGLGSTINSALSQIGLDGVLDASRINGLPVGDQISLLAQIISLQTMVDLQMVNSREVIIVLNQGFRSSGLNVVINA